jgi:D-alanyl-D-alanine carboxypeptidase/D-alanyl-D-alanine-endopeptidase (penicillin-binding protein 4)
MAIQDPRLYAKKILDDLLKKVGIKYNALVFDKTPKKLQSFAIIPSPAINKILKKMMYESDNLIAETLVKKIASQISNKEGSWNIGTKAIVNLLREEFDFQDTDIAVKDGSGGSRKNLISPNAMVEILTAAYRDESISDDFLSSFPQAGQVNSSLEKRFMGIASKVKIYAKTGTLDNVSTLSGYVFCNSGRNYVFSIMTNNAICNKGCSSLKNLEEEVLATALKLEFN